MTTSREVPTTFGFTGALAVAVVFGAVTWFGSENIVLAITVAVLAAAGWLGAFAVHRHRR